MEDERAYPGDMVLLVRKLHNGKNVNAWMPAALAVAEAGYHVDNGTVYVSCRIVALDVDMGDWDRSC